VPGVEGLIYIHNLRLQVVSGNSFIKGNINLVAMDEDESKVSVQSNKEVVNNSESFFVEFEESFSNDSYSISIQPQDPTQYWYDQKSVGGFRIRFERPYNGLIYWSAVLKQED
jgi:hypothetical protein